MVGDRAPPVLGWGREYGCAGAEARFRLPSPPAGSTEPCAGRDRTGPADPAIGRGRDVAGGVGGDWQRPAPTRSTGFDGDGTSFLQDFHFDTDLGLSMGFGSCQEIGLLPGGSGLLSHGTCDDWFFHRIRRGRRRFGGSGRRIFLGVGSLVGVAGFRIPAPAAADGGSGGRRA